MTSTTRLAQIDPNPWTARPARDLDAIQANHDLNRGERSLSNNPWPTAYDAAMWQWVCRKEAGQFMILDGACVPVMQMAAE